MGGALLRRKRHPNPATQDRVKRRERFPLGHDQAQMTPTKGAVLYLRRELLGRKLYI